MKVSTEFTGIILLVVLSVWHGRSERYGAFWMVMYRLPSTVLHEICHLVVGLATLSGVTGFSLLPKRVEGGWVLGSVTCNRVGMLSALPIGLAPALVCLPLAWQAYQLHTAVGYAGVYLCLTAATPSAADIKVAFSSLIGVTFWLAVAVGLLQLSERVPLRWSAFLNCFS